MKCSVCLSEKAESLWPEIKVVKCECGHIYYNEKLSNDEINELYTDKYFKGEEYSDYLSDKDIIQKNFSKRLKVIKRFAPQGRLLEIGSAYGFFLELAKNNYETEGFEICKEAALHAKDQLKLNVHHADFLAETVEGSRDVVCLFDCIEHLERPELFIEKISKLMNKNGKIVITTGDIGTLVPKMRGKNWRLVHPPTHIHYFSFNSLEKLLNRYGFKVVHRGYPGVWRSVNQVATSVLKTKKPVELFPFSFYLNTFDIMEVIAVKE